MSSGVKRCTHRHTVTWSTATPRSARNSPANGLQASRTENVEASPDHAGQAEAAQQRPDQGRASSCSQPSRHVPGGQRNGAAEAHLVGEDVPAVLDEECVIVALVRIC